jgi:hypothetical protein
MNPATCGNNEPARVTGINPYRYIATQTEAS